MHWGGGSVQLKAGRQAAEVREAAAEEVGQWLLLEQKEGSAPCKGGGRKRQYTTDRRGSCRQHVQSLIFLESCLDYFSFSHQTSIRIGPWRRLGPPSWRDQLNLHNISDDALANDEMSLEGYLRADLGLGNAQRRSRERWRRERSNTRPSAEL